MMAAPLMTLIRDDRPSLGMVLRRLVRVARRAGIPYELVEPDPYAGVCLRMDCGRILVQLAAPQFHVDGQPATLAQLFAKVVSVGHLHMAVDIIRASDERARAIGEEE